MNKIAGKLFFLVLTCMVCANVALSQDTAQKLVEIGRKDDTAALAALITKDKVDVCYENTTALIILVKLHAMKCIDKLLNMGADINKGCGEEKIPVFHVVKHCGLDMLKYFESKGADMEAAYASAFSPHETLLEYAIRCRKGDIVQYLGSKK